MTYSILGNAVVTINTANSDIVGSFGNVSILTRFTGNLLPNTTIYSAQAQLPVGFVISENLFQGTIAGFTSGGSNNPNPSPSAVSFIQKINFNSNIPSSSIGNLATTRDSVTGQSSYTHGYTAGGSKGAVCYNYGCIDKFPFAIGGTAAITGSLTQARYSSAGQSSSSAGYTSGGYCVFTTNLSRIDKFPFASDTTITCIGALVTAKNVQSGGISSSTNGYVSAGNINSGPTPQNVCIIEKFPFATDSSAINVGCTICRRYDITGISSSTSGYSVGGGVDYPPPAPSAKLNFIERFPFASESGSISVGSLVQARGGAGGLSSTEHGYASAGYNGSASSALIDRFPFATDVNATFFNNASCTVNSHASTQD